MQPHPTIVRYRQPLLTRLDADTAGRVRVLVVHGSELIRTGLVELLRTERVCDIPAGTGSIHDAYRLAEAVPPSVVLFEFLAWGGAEAARLLSSITPSPRLIALVASSDIAPAVALASGVQGVVSMEGASRESFVAAIRSVLAGNLGVIAGFAAAALTAQSSPVDTSHGLTGRERELLYLIGEGLTNREIADLLDLSVKTIDTHRGNLSRKLGLRSRAGLIRLALGAAAPSFRVATGGLRPALRADA